MVTYKELGTGERAAGADQFSLRLANSSRTSWIECPFFVAAKEIKDKLKHYEAMA